MNILVLTDRFTPEVTAVSVRTLAHARVWRDLGHNVIVVTSVPNFPRGQLFSGYRNRLYQEEYLEGIRVIRLWTYMAANEGTVRRTLDYMSFAWSVVFQCYRLPDFDVIIATSPPIFVAAAGHILSVLRKRPWIFGVRDLWPASIAAVGVSKSRMLRLVESLELYLYRRATRVLSLTYSFKKNLVARGIDAEKIDVVTNGIDLNTFRRPEIKLDIRDSIGVSCEDFLVGYIGTVGMAHGLETLVNVAHQCRDIPALRFLIMGEGAERSRLESLAKELKLDNIIFKDFVPHEEVPVWLAALDLSFVHLKAEPLFETVIPSKIFEAMAVGVPILHAVQGESAEIIRSARCGICVRSGDEKAIAETVIDLRSDLSALQKMGESGMAAIKSFSRESLGRDVISTLEKSLRLAPRRDCNNPVVAR